MIGPMSNGLIQTLKRADDEFLLLEGTADAVPPHFVIVSRFKDERWKEELFLDVLRPLLAPVGGCDYQNAALAFGPLLSKHLAAAAVARVEGKTNETMRVSFSTI
jgi:hypothetical protein